MRGATIGVPGRWWEAGKVAPKSRVELFAAIRRDSRVEGLSVRGLARKYGVHRRDVRAALSGVWPAPRKRPLPRTSRLDPFKPAIDAMLRADLDAPRKQRHTSKRIYDRLVAEHQMAAVSYSTVCAYVCQRRPRVRAEAGRGPEQVFVPQSHRPGQEAEVDFGEVVVNLAGVATTCYAFVFRLSYSGKAVHRVFLTCGQAAFFEGHVYALRVLGGVPRGKVRYDNLTPAVAKVLFGRGRAETDRWVALRSHYGLDAFYCQPGAEGAHEKGGVEGQVGYFRRNRCVPVPDVASLAELNALVEAWDADDDGRRIGLRARTVGELFTAERRLLAPLPAEEFEPGWATTARVDRYGQVSVGANRYSVPVRLAGRRVRVLLRANEVLAYDGARLVAAHARLAGRGRVRLELDHYLEALVRKPGALAGATALEQARAAGVFTPAHEAWWAAARAAHGDAAGTRALVEVLLLHRHTDHAHVVAGIAAALAAGALTADAVAVEARKAAQDSAAAPEPATAPPPPVASLTARRLAALPADTRPLPSVAAYDQLLPTRRRGETP